jgi:hypothetical protein
MSATPLQLVSPAGAEGVDADTALARARAAEAAGELDAAVSELNRVLALDPDHLAALRALARLLTDRGQTERAAACYERLLAVSPGDAEAALELGALREAEGRVDEAVALYQDAAARSADTRLENASRAAELAAGPREQSAGPPPAPAPLSAAPTDAHAVALADLFAGREGTHARQWAGEDGRAGYTPVHEPFTPAVARHHLLGTLTAGIYPLRLDLTARFLCFDLDVTREALRAAAGTPSERARLVARTQELAARLLAELAALGLPALLEDSGNKGRHVWLLLREPLLAVHLRRLGQALVDRLGVLPEGIQVELFPRQSRVERGALGNLVKLPLGIHRATGRRSLFLDGAGEPLPSQLDLLLDPPRVTAEAVAAALERLTPGGGGAPDDSDPERAPARSPEPTPARVRAEPEAPYRIEDDLEVQRVLSGCAVLAELVRRVTETGAIDAEERLVVTHTLGCLSRGAQAVNAVLSHVADLDPALRLASRLRGSPTSCARIRSRVPELAERAGCDCAFAPGSLYPSPVLHAGDSSRTPILARHEVDRAVKDYLRLRSELDRIARAAGELARRLRAVMAEQGLEVLATSVGKLRAGPGELDLVLEV